MEPNSRVNEETEKHITEWWRYSGTSVKTRESELSSRRRWEAVQPCVSLLPRHQNNEAPSTRITDPSSPTSCYSFLLHSRLVPTCPVQEPSSPHTHTHTHTHCNTPTSPVCLISSVPSNSLPSLIAFLQSESKAIVTRTVL